MKKEKIKLFPAIAKNIISMLKEVVLPALVYLCVCAICGLAGYLFNQKPQPFRIHLWLAAISTFFFYIQWVLIYDKRNETVEKNNIRAIIFHTFYISSLVAVYFIIRNNDFSNEKNLSVCFLWFSLPYLVLYAYIAFYHTPLRLFGKRKINFRALIFFPAIVTCLMPFLYCYLEPNQIKYFVIISIIIIIFFLLIMSEKIYLRTVRVYIVALFLFALLSFLFYESFSIGTFIFLNSHDLEVVRAFIVGTIFTLLIGLTESWWYVNDPKNQIFKSTEKSLAYYKFNVDIATHVLPFFAPFLLIHKSFHWGTIGLILFTAFLYYDYEKNFENELRQWKRRRLIYGVSICLLFILSTIKINELTFLRFEGLSEVTSINILLITMITLSMGLLAILSNSETLKAAVSKILTTNKLISISICVFIFLASWIFEIYSSNKAIAQSNKPIPYTYGKLTASKIDSLSDANIITQQMFLYNYDSATQVYTQQKGYLLSLNRNQNSELLQRASTTKLIYGIWLMILILWHPIKLLLKKHKFLTLRKQISLQKNKSNNPTENS